jgi:anti-sigma B factor antagonist
LLLSGELDISTAASLELELQAAELRRPPVLVLDLGQLRFMGVSGLRSILNAARRARREGRHFVVTNPLPHIVRLFELTAIDQSLELHRGALQVVDAGAPA